MTQQVKGIVEGIVYRNADNGYTIAEIVTNGDHLTVVGCMPSLCCGEIITAEGQFTHHSNYGKQLTISHYSTELPTGKEGISLYLCGGALKGVGPVLAHRIVAEFGENTFEILSTDAAALSKVKGITEVKAREIVKEFNRAFGLRETILSLTAMGLSAQTAMKAYGEYGDETAELVRSNAYVMCEPPIFLDFRLADKIAEQFSVEYDTRERLVAGLYYVFHHNINKGHTCLPKDIFIETVAQFVGIEPERINELLREEFDASKVVIEVKEGKEYVYLTDYYETESEIAATLLSMKARNFDNNFDFNHVIALENELNIEYAPLQREAIAGAIENGVFVLTGGPGTGKTTTVNAILTLLERSMQRVALVAPTGRAAKRMSELCSRSASTIHRLLEVNFAKGEELKFLYNENRKLKVDVVVVDEMSMVDIFLFKSLIRALPDNAKLIMVGDFEQLPSVGPGCILRSILDSNMIPSVSLEEIFRQAQDSLIVKNAHRILKGQMPTFNNKDGDYYYIEKAGDGAQETVLSLASGRLQKKYGYDPMTDIQVLCATKVGPVGTVALNPLLQNLLNPPSAEKQEIKSGGRIFRLGDKVMQIKNDYNIEYIRKDGSAVGSGIYNGDIGFIEKIDRRRGTITVRVDDRHYSFVPEQLTELELAYAITIHKSQGSEFSAVILPLSEIPKKLCYRNLLYTGVTRAKELLVVVGEMEVLHSMITNAKGSNRCSLLKEYLDGNI